MSITNVSSSASQGYFRPRRLGHVNLYVSDIDRMMTFYNRILGIEEVYRTPLVGGGFLSNGNTHHDIGFTDANGPLGKPRGAKPGELNHLGIELGTEKELVDSYQRATKAGHKFMRTADHDIAHSVYNKDPAGNVYELYADVVVDWRNQRSGMVTKPKPAWTPGSTAPVETPCYEEDPKIRRVAEAIFHIERTSHATLVVADMAATIEHYTSIVGMKVVDRTRDDQLVALGGNLGQRSIVLVKASDTLKPGYHHVGLQVRDPDDLAASTDQARSEGIPIEIELMHAGRRAVFVRDPEGFLIQLFSDEKGQPSLDKIEPNLGLYIL